MPVSPERCRRMSAMTRSRIAAGSITWPVSCGPSSLITSMWIEFLRSANGSFCGAAAVARRLGRDESLVEFHGYFLLKRNRDRTGAARLGRCRGHRLARWRRRRDEEAGEVVERGRGVRLRPGENDRHALVDGARDLAVARDEDVRLAAEHGDDVALADADAPVGAVEDEPDLLRVVVHQPERLEPELRVLERERVEHADHDEVGARVDRRDHLGGEARRRVDDDEVVLRPRDDEHVAEQLDR